MAKVNKTADMNQYKKNWYENNKANMQPIICPCGITVSYYAMSKHRRSKSHKNYVIYTHNEPSSSNIISTG
jgi:hypothetical protein